MESGTLVEWKIKPGDVVKRGDVVAVVETDKGAIDIEIFESGPVEKLLVEPGTNVPVGGVLALIGGEASTFSTDALTGAESVPEKSAAATNRGQQVPSTHLTESTTGPHGRQKISPAARVRAQQRHVDLESLHGTGPGGAITLQDVERNDVSHSDFEPSAVTKKTPSATEAMRAVIASAMARSKREIPHYYLSTDVDYSSVNSWLAKRNAELPIEQRMLPVVPLLRAIALTLQAFPDFNGYYQDKTYQPSKAVHLGVAIAQRGGGLIAPAILDAQDQQLPLLTEKLRDLVNRARAGRLKNRELSDGIITLTSLGDGGVDSLFPVIYPPQVAIIGAGSVRDRATVVNGKLAARPIMTLTLAADHRVSNGRSGAQFLARIRDLLQIPEKL